MVQVRWIQKTLELKKPRGFHLITREVTAQIPELVEVRIGLLHVFLQHTSASLTLNENASAEVRGDFERHFDRLAPEDAPYYRHTLEGPDDMPAHLKAALLGNSLTLPVREGKLALGTWQGIYLGEHRNHGGSRHLILTLHGEWDGSNSQ
jgi:secondary thiamine-phosphate synthase enzyme